ncbi:MAG TPA: hypothetical protein VEA60_07140 [Allosphingosinicella sp.]|nr:hypothetical protein [Allosphingosinicella sp.]
MTEIEQMAQFVRRRLEKTVAAVTGNIVRSRENDRDAPRFEVRQFSGDIEIPRGVNAADDEMAAGGVFRPKGGNEIAVIETGLERRVGRQSRAGEYRQPHIRILERRGEAGLVEGRRTNAVDAMKPDANRSHESPESRY